eukprot:606299-Amphidinium_carterae.3
MAEKCLSSNSYFQTRLEGGEQVQKTQTWPATLTQTIVKNIGKVLSENVREPTFLGVYGVRPGCSGHKSALDPSHTRIPGECRLADDIEAMSKARVFVVFVPRSSGKNLKNTSLRITKSKQTPNNQE